MLHFGEADARVQGLHCEAKETLHFLAELFLFLASAHDKEVAIVSGYSEAALVSIFIVLFAI